MRRTRVSSRRPEWSDRLVNSQTENLFGFSRKELLAHRDGYFGDPHVRPMVSAPSLSIFAYTRTLGAERFLVVLNFSETPVTYTLPGGLKVGALLLSNTAGTEHGGDALHLAGWEARVYKLQ